MIIATRTGPDYVETISRDGDQFQIEVRQSDGDGFTETAGLGELQESIRTAFHRFNWSVIED